MLAFRTESALLAISNLVFVASKNCGTRSTLRQLTKEGMPLGCEREVLDQLLAFFCRQRVFQVRQALPMIDDQDNSASFDLTLEVGDYFGLSEDDTHAIVSYLVKSISTWRTEAAPIGISAEEMDRMASAFEHVEMERAQTFLRT